MTSRPSRLGLSGPVPTVGSTDRFLMIVKTYPSPSKKYGETVCCAGIDVAKHEWIRMFPVNFRSLEEWRRFHKWQFVDASWEPALDGRPESRHVLQDTIHAGPVLPAGRGWQYRREWLDPLVDQSIESLEEQRVATRKSLGVIRPAKITKLSISPAEPWDPDSVRELEQLSLMWTDSPKPVLDLERLPFDFFYHFTCQDDRCRGHRMKILDWEAAQTYRNFRHRYGPVGWEAPFRRVYEERIPSLDVHLVMGTHHRMQVWMIVGVLYPPHPNVPEGQRRAVRKRPGEQPSMTPFWVDLEAQQGENLGSR